jgi:hypothetical protein
LEPENVQEHPLEPEEPKSGESWRRWEIDALVAAYFNMLSSEVRGERPVKADVNRGLQTLLPARSRGSIEYKLQNVSAVLDEERLPSIDGYKPARNFQRELREAVVAWVRGHSRIAESLASYGATPPPPSIPIVRRRDVEVEPPGSSRRSHLGSHLTQGWWGALRDEQMRQLGEAGEEWVVNVERAELQAVGRPDLARQVEWTSRERGDGLGYDVQSFESSGVPIQIEVKTTNLGIRSPFLVTRNEVSISRDLAETYRIYRVFDFARERRVFIVPGAVADRFILEPTVYEATIM